MKIAHRRDGESRVRTGFLWWPKYAIETKDTRWLETAKWFEVYYKDVTGGYWLCNNWIDDNN
jgi:hypothetical protein